MERAYYFGKILWDTQRLVALSAHSRSHRQGLARIIAQELDPRLLPVLEFIMLNRLSDVDRERIRRVENLRAALAARGGETVEILYSPRPGSAGELDRAAERPRHGDVKHFTLEWVARLTSKYKYWGTILYLLSNHCEVGSVLEFGACAGISGAYMLSGETCQRLVTIEGSSALASLAKETLGNHGDHKNFEVLNCLFDDGLDLLLQRGGEKFDMVYIDGHHEKVATLHYLDRTIPLLKEGSLVVFDDIYWSQDMNDAWKIIQGRQGFSTCVDLGEFGVCVWDGRTRVPVLRNLNAFTAGLFRWRPRRPHGWR
jgi:predicted O-methyltransferase YrrM